MKLRNFGYAALVVATGFVIAIGSAVPSDAKAKKKTAAAPASSPAVFCIDPYKPVCGEKGGMKNTYANACFARQDGAKVVSTKACSTKAAKAPKAKKKAMKQKAAKQ